ncbi:protein of unknown function [Magnetospirillum gryphiswaldense MSR-1 v2]|uniref:Uncharacterized protein n=1 Tax=Magnetospirillum gryphiswaldense (strain DSM 6361 / JCM 21280 / NBRC 15271 / MSR-1) TaxID=431944 RepID=V6EW62_MAGGM|nr:protein of unknown function [Magnetospirillum gryphiswaldense MSR-1 v2]
MCGVWAALAFFYECARMDQAVLFLLMGVCSA